MISIKVCIFHHAFQFVVYDCDCMDVKRLNPSS